MPNKIIFQDKDAIIKAKAALSTFLPVVNQLHECFSSIGINMNENDMIAFMKLVSQHGFQGANEMLKQAAQGDEKSARINRGHNNKFSEPVKAIESNAVIDFLKEKLIDQSGENFKVGNLPLNRDKLKELIQLPDLSTLSEILTHQTVNIWKSYTAFGYGREGELIDLGPKGYYAVKNADDIIAERSTYRTTTDKGDKYLKELQAVCEALNAFSGNYCREIKIDTNDGNCPIIKLARGNYVPNYNFISAFEKL